MRDYLNYITSGDIAKDVKEYFEIYDREETYEHTLDVVNELYLIEKQHGNIEPESLTACILHDIGRVVKNEDIIEFCNSNHIIISKEEYQLPSILHQKISCYIAKKVFGISNDIILNAIRYHTTLRKNPTMTDIEVFLSDKMSWKEAEYRKLALKIKEALQESKEKAVYYYLNDLHTSRQTLKLYHIDSMDAYEFFSVKYS